MLTMLPDGVTQLFNCDCCSSREGPAEGQWLGVAKHIPLKYDTTSSCLSLVSRVQDVSHCFYITIKCWDKMRENERNGKCFSCENKTSPCLVSRWTWAGAGRTLLITIWYSHHLLPPHSLHSVRDLLDKVLFFPLPDSRNQLEDSLRLPHFYVKFHSVVWGVRCEVRARKQTL